MGEGPAGEGGALALTGIFNRLEELSAQTQTPAGRPLDGGDQHVGTRTPRLVQVLRESPVPALPVNDVSDSPIFPGVAPVDPEGLPLPAYALERSETGDFEPQVQLDERDPPRPWRAGGGASGIRGGQGSQEPRRASQHAAPSGTQSAAQRAFLPQPGQARRFSGQAASGIAPQSPDFQASTQDLSAEELLRRAGELLGM